MKHFEPSEKVKVTFKQGNLAGKVFFGLYEYCYKDSDIPHSVYISELDITSYPVYDDEIEKAD